MRGMVKAWLSQLCSTFITIGFHWIDLGPLISIQRAFVLKVRIRGL